MPLQPHSQINKCYYMKPNYINFKEGWYALILQTSEMQKKKLKQQEYCLNKYLDKHFVLYVHSSWEDLQLAHLCELEDINSLKVPE